MAIKIVTDATREADVLKATRPLFLLWVPLGVLTAVALHPSSRSLLANLRIALILVLLIAKRIPPSLKSTAE